MDAFQNCHMKAHTITDVLPPEDLFILKKKLLNFHDQNLKHLHWNERTQIEERKIHHAIPHYANGGMRPALLDALTFAGMTNENLQLRYYHDVLHLKKHLRAEATYEF